MANSIAQGIADLARAEKEVERLQKLLDEAKAKVNYLEQIELPALFDEAEEYDVELASGYKAKRKLKVIGALPKIDPKADSETRMQQVVAREKAFEWLSAQGYDPLIKCTVIAEFDKGDKGQAEVVAARVRAMTNSAAVALKEDIHPQTLFAQMRRRVEEGKDVPFETLGLSVLNVVEITRRPKE